MRIPSPSPALSALQMSRASPVYLCVACSSMFDDDEAGGLLFHVCHSLSILPFRNQLVHSSLPFFGQCADPSLSSPVPPPPLSPFFVLLSCPLLLPSLALPARLLFPPSRYPSASIFPPLLSDSLLPSPLFIPCLFLFFLFLVDVAVYAYTVSTCISLSPSSSTLSLSSKQESSIPQHPSLSLLSYLPLFTAPACIILFFGSIIARKCHVPYNACSCRMPNVFSFHQISHPKPR